MNQPFLTGALGATHEEFAAFVDALPPASFEAAPPGKWTPGQQLAHLVLCLKPIAAALASKEYIDQKFGRLDRTTWTQEEVLARYRAGLAAGGTAPERFLPPPVASADKAAWLDALRSELRSISGHVAGYTDAELDSLALPHPFLGLLSIRELLYLMTYHATHHLRQVQTALAQPLAADR
ncbi:DinB family protein [Flaviaesturariibacter terrae]